MNNKPKVALVGAGAMGGAMFRGWIASSAIDAPGSAIFDPGAPTEITELARSRSVRMNPDIGAEYDFLIIAVKPQMAGRVLPAYAPVADGAVALSIMAGTSVATLSKSLGGPTKIIRAMPNLPAAIGAGVTGLFASSAVSREERAAAERLIAAVGASVWVEQESDIDLVTAVSGSGPAYFFLLAEALAQAGASAGLSQAASARLAEATLAGAGALIAADGRNAAEMRKAVTSPGGTTAAALDVLDGDGKAIRTLIEKAVAAAAKRAGELAD